uniref:Ig-like domain-containing protein n=1 Tax=Biomphalaria glabrata TaxID=6526 RepID=A0A2C9JL74_BIOGL
MNRSLRLFYFVCIIAQIQANNVFLSNTTLMEGQPLQIECNIFVIGKSMSNISCIFGIALREINETTQIFYNIVERSQVKTRNGESRPWWNVTVAFVNSESNDCKNNSHVANIKVFVKAVRMEDSGLYNCYIIPFSEAQSRPNYVHSINGSLTVLKKNTTERIETSTQTSQNVDAREKNTVEEEIEGAKMTNQRGVLEGLNSTTPGSGARDKCNKVKPVFIMTALMWHLVFYLG